MNSEEEWIELFEKLEANDMKNEEKSEKKIELFDNFTEYFDDYCKISYLEDLKEENVYLINKWKFLFYHCAQFDDYLFYLKPNLQEKSKSKKKFNKTKINKSTILKVNQYLNLYLNLEEKKEFIAKTNNSQTETTKLNLSNLNLTKNEEKLGLDDKNLEQNNISDSKDEKKVIPVKKNEENQNQFNIINEEKEKIKNEKVTEINNEDKKFNDEIEVKKENNTEIKLIKEITGYIETKKGEIDKTTKNKREMNIKEEKDKNITIILDEKDIALAKESKNNISKKDENKINTINEKEKKNDEKEQRTNQIEPNNKNLNEIIIDESKENNNDLSDMNNNNSQPINFNLKIIEEQENSEEATKINLNEFNLIEAKKSLNIYDNETIDEKEFELKCKRILNIMLIFIQKDNYRLLNPQKISLQNILNNLEIKQLKNVKLTNGDNFEIDIVINNFKLSDLNRLFIKFPSHFLFTDKINFKISKENENINLIGEISKNFIFQINQKSKQLESYNAVFKIIGHLKEKNCSEEKNKILSSFGLEQNDNKNIFLIITDGSYPILRFVFDTIRDIKQLTIKNKNLTKKEIEEFINSEIENNKNKELISHLMTDKFKNLTKYIFWTYKGLKYLEKNNIPFFILFIGDKENNIIENFYKERKEINREVKLENGFRFKKINELITELKTVKKNFCENIVEYGKSIQNLIKKIRFNITYIYYQPKLSNYFKINIIIYYMNQIENEFKSEKYVVISKELKKERFLSAYKELFESNKNRDYLLIKKIFYLLMIIIMQIFW